MIHERIAKLILFSGISQNQFCKEIGVSPPAIHNIIKGRLRKPSFHVLEKILLSYKEISADWLITGEGEMWGEKSLLQGNKINSNNIVNRVLRLIEEMRNKGGQEEEAYELGDWVELLVDANHEQRRAMMKLHKRQEDTISILKKYKHRV